MKADNKNIKGNELSQKIEQERLRLLFAPLISNQVIATFMATLVLLTLFSQVVSWWMLAPWLILVITSIAYHTWLHFQFSQQAINQNFNPAPWEKKFLVGVGIAALVWGSSCLFLFVPESESHQIYLSLIIAGVCIVAIKLLGPSNKAMIIFSLVAVFPYLIYSIITFKLIAVPVLVLISLQLVMSYINGNKFKHDYYNSQSLQYASKQREYKLLKSEERYALWFTKSSTPMMLITSKKILKANKAATKLFGYPSVSQLTKVKPKQLVPQLQAHGLISINRAKFIKEQLFATGTHSFEWLIKKLDATFNPVFVSLTLVPLHNKKAAFILLQDASAIKSKEKKLMKEKQYAESENIAKSEFLANISQSIFTPMNGVLGQVNLLMKHQLNQDQMIRARVIKRSAESLFAIINDVLDITKIEAGKLQLDNRDYDLINLLESFTATAKNQLKKKDITFNSHIDPKIYRWYKGDAGRVIQIIEKLFSNAVKFTNHGKITLICKKVKENKSKALLRFDMIDTGHGVSELQQEYLFNRFAQADGSASGKIGNTGLGLSMCQRLTEMMGGQIGYNPNTKQGAHFWFSLKLNKTKAITPKNKGQTNQQKNIQSFDAKVLVIDDNRTSLMVAKGTLEVFSLDIHLVNSGKEALDVLRKEDFDLVFMDCVMPDMDGYQTTGNIRDVKSGVRNPNIPIIAMTSNNKEGDREKCIDSGMNDYIAKPIDIRVIQQILQFWLLKK